MNFTLEQLETVTYDELVELYLDERKNLVDGDVYVFLSDVEEEKDDIIECFEDGAPKITNIGTFLNDVDKVIEE